MRCWRNLKSVTIGHQTCHQYKPSPTSVTNIDLSRRWSSEDQYNMNAKENIFNRVENGTILIFDNFIFLLVLIIWTLGLSDFGGWSIRRVKSGADINILRNFNDVMFPRMDIPN